MVTRQQRRAQERARAKQKQPRSILQYAARLLLLLWKLLLRLLLSIWRKVTDLPWWADVLGVVIAASSIYLFYYQTIPTVDVPAENDELSPFTAPFRVSNPSLLFAATDVFMFCAVDKIGNAHGTIMEGGGVLSDRIESLARDSSGAMRCAVGIQGDPRHEMVQTTSREPITFAHIKVFLEYRTFGILRHAEGVEFTWYQSATKRYWVKGTIAKE